ncbi:hypothetical protein L9G74_11255 [Shewanella sp. C32]|uniref:Uncharacterized protein n=1 Tax=Shewanella electrica TaxID=515560 RepID=A0ABT2FL17_9GAMM|nr:hypothetical protein [Shewanella electrica]MCH1923803.1 hypothetical protein [Shewanella electrica]MCS4557021.1 hypothetical protein [Shewanella electrica]
MNPSGSDGAIGDKQKSKKAKKQKKSLKQRASGYKYHRPMAGKEDCLHF